MTNYRYCTSNLHNRYYALRHGKSEANEQGLIISNPEDGVPRYGLSEEGREQVRVAIQAAHVNAILDASTILVSSDFARAYETAMIAQSMLGAEAPIITPQLRERFFGAWDRQSNSNYQRVWEHDAVDPSHTYHGVESAIAVQTRTTDLICDLEQRYSARTILLISHGDALQILQAAFEGVDPACHRQIRHLETAELRALNPAM